jgi:diadenosine tetraphosphate (Ap4A) HIT family hydrolase
MPDESPLEFGDCTFCNREQTAGNLLHEGRDFYVIADHAPVADAHILLIPRHHYPYLAALPPELEEEFASLKAKFGEFVRENYGPITYWENGVFGQSVPHAHLHLLSVSMDTALLADHGAPVGSLAELRSHHETTPSHYFLVEHEGVGRVMPPDPVLYHSIIADAKARNGGTWAHTAADRRIHGRARVESLIQRWREHVAGTGSGSGSIANAAG